MKKSLEQINKWTFIVLFGIVFFTVLFKLIYVPITHDEVSTTFTLKNSSFWELITYNDPVPNNHILNSILTKLVVSVTGVSQISIRVVNLIFFGVFALGTWRISKTLFSLKSYFFIPASLIFITNPYLLDFFSLCRGYGISVAFCTLSLSYLISGFSLKVNKHIWWALIFSSLASYANFTLLYFWSSTIIVAFLYFIIYRKELRLGLIKNVIWLLILSLIYGVMIALPILKMTSTNQFRFWNSNGFYTDTFYPLVKESLYGSKALFFQLYEVISYLAIGILFFNFCYLILKSRKKELRTKLIQNPIFVTTLILLLTVTINIAHAFLLDSPYLSGRTALFYYPLFVGCFISTFALFSPSNLPKTKLFFSLTVTLLCLIQLVHTWKSDLFLEWYYDAKTLKVIEFLDRERDGGNVTLDTDWIFNPSFSFYDQFNEIKWLKLGSYDKEIHPNTNSKYYYVMYYNMPKLRENFDILFEFKTGGVLMVKHQQNHL